MRTLQTACLLLLLGAASSAQATTYRWVDDKGVVHYSDRPQPGAEKVNLPPAQTYSSGPAAPATAAPSTPDVNASATPGLTGSDCAITAPRDEQTFNNVSSLTITARGPMAAAGPTAVPAFGEARLMLDGGLKQKGMSTEFLVNPIDRGMHRAIVIFTSLGGGELCRTKPVTFYVRQATINRPGAVRPKG